MNKVLQAAGRVIRTKEDQGVILLLDQRFRQREYSNLFPLEWDDRQLCTLSDVEEYLQKFWAEAKNHGEISANDKLSLIKKGE